MDSTTIIFLTVLATIAVISFAFRLWNMDRRISALEKADKERFPYWLRTELETLKVSPNYSKFERLALRGHLESMQQKLDMMDALDQEFEKQYEKLNERRK